MNKILNKQELEEFIKENKIECYSIIIKLDEEKQKAFYIVDGKKMIETNYNEAKKYFE